MRSRLSVGQAARSKTHRAEQLVEALLDDPETGVFRASRHRQGDARAIDQRPAGCRTTKRSAALQGVLIGPDQSTTCVVLTVSDRVLADRAEAVD